MSSTQSPRSRDNRTDAPLDASSSKSGAVSPIHTWPPSACLTRGPELGGVVICDGDCDCGVGERETCDATRAGHETSSTSARAKDLIAHLLRSARQPRSARAGRLQSLDLSPQ